MEKDKKKEGLLPEDGASEEVTRMTREEALEYMGLPVDCDKEALENRFWQLSKKYGTMCGDYAEQKIADLSAAYDIATGNRDLREEAAKARANEKQFLGKTKSEWKNYVSYTWKYYVAGVVALVATVFLIYTFFFKPSDDCGIISIGNFAHTEEYYDGIVRELGFKHPNLMTYNYVTVNKEGQQPDIYENQAATTSLYSGANVLVTDKATMPYFFEYFTDCSALYKSLESELPAGKYAKITPMYMSEKEYQKMINEYRRSHGYDLSGKDADLSSYSDAKIMTGLLIEDAEMIKKLGYTNYWQDQPASLVFGINVLSKDQDESKMIITAVLKSL